MVERRVLVRGLSDSADEDVVSMIFESPSFCPLGGDVESVQLLEDGVAVVTFEDSEVAKALINSQSLMFRDSQLKLGKYTESVPRRATSPPQDSNDNSDIEDDDLESIQSRSSLFHHVGDKDREKNPIDVQRSTGNDSSASENLVEKRKSSLLFDDAITKITKTDSSEEEAIITLPAQECKPSVCRSDKVSNNSPDRELEQETTDSVFFPIQQLQLLLLLLLTELNELSGLIKVDLEKKCVDIRGSSKTKMSTQYRIYESIQEWSNDRVELKSNVVRLLQTDIGKGWLDSLFSGIPAVFYVVDDAGYLIAKDDTTLDLARQVIETSVSSDWLTVEYSMRDLVESDAFKGVVEDLQGSKIVAIETSRSCVTVEGEGEDVKSVVKKLQSFLNDNCLDKISIPLDQAGKQRLLEKHHAVTIKKLINSCPLADNKKMDISFTENSLEISGPKVIVDWAKDEIQDKFLKTICMDKFNVNKPGVKMADFKNITSEEGKLLLELEKKNACVIELQTLPSTKSAKFTAAPVIVSDSSGDKAKAVPVPVAVQPPKPAGFLQGVIATVYGAGRAVPSTGQASQLTITVRQGSLVEFKEADVLVNLITRKTRQLKDAGIVSKSFANAELQAAIDVVGWPHDFGSDVSVTPASANLKAKKVFHAAIRKYQNKESVEHLFDLIIECLQMTVDEKLTSIAFPTLGCGKLNFTPDIVSDCFNRAAQEFSHKIQVYIVAYERSLFNHFKSNCSGVHAPPTGVQASPLTVSTALQQTAGLAAAGPAATTPITASSSIPAPAAQVVNPAAVAASVTPARGDAVSDWSLPAVHKGLVFCIFSLDDKAADKVKEELNWFFDNQVKTKKIASETLEYLSEETKKEIRGLVSEDLAIQIDHKDGAIILTGRTVPVKSAGHKIKDLLGKEKKVHNFEIIKKRDGVRAYLRALAQHEEPEFPRHWTHYKGPCKVTPYQATPKRTELAGNSAIYIAVNNLVQKTWEAAKAGGLGKDAVNLTHTAIDVKKIWTIENPSLYQKYLTQKRYLCNLACENLFPKIDGLDGEWEVQTRKLGLTVLDENLEPEINEYYLIHGSSHVANIEMHGIDSRWAGEGTMFGRGAYYAESSTKADQYADSKEGRVGKNQPLHMFVVRVPLGRPHISREPRKFKKPPCTLATCLKDDCIDHAHGMCNSVIGTHRDKNQTRLIFREFIVYHPDQEYPEFLVEYERL